MASLHFNGPCYILGSVFFPRNFLLYRWKRCLFMDTTASRFGIALAVSSLVIGLVGFVVYADHPETPIKPALIHRHASVFELSATAAANDARYDQARSVLAKFVAALS